MDEIGGLRVPRCFHFHHAIRISRSDPLSHPRAVSRMCFGSRPQSWGFQWLVRLGPWLLIGVSLLALPLCFFWATFRSSNYLFVIALALISSGAAGNLYDRWVIGGVRDFIRWSVKWGNTEYVWPNFNLADSHIVIGVAIVMVLEWRKPEISEATHP